MKKLFVILGIAAIATTACNKSLNEVSTPSSEGTHLVFTATTDEADASKTTLGLEGVVNWTSTDQIQVNASDKNEVNTFSIASCSGNTATFEGAVKTEGTEYYALYPASAYVKFDTSKSKIQFNVPSNQTAFLGGFADGVNVAVAHTSGSSFTFLNVLSYVYFNLQQDNVTKVELTTGGTADTDYLAGETCKIQVAKDATSGDGLTYDNPGGTRYKTVSIGDGSTVLKKGVYYLALYPCDGSNKQAKLKGFTMTLTNNEGKQASKTSENTLTVPRGTARNLGTISGLSFGNTLEVDKSSVSVSASAGSSTINVTSSTSWTASISGTGFSIDKNSGSGNAAITVSYTENTSTTDSRSATLTIKSGDTTLDPVTVSFTQAKASSGGTKYERDFGDGNVNSDTFWTIDKNGSAASVKTGLNVTICGKTYTKALKIESRTTVTFTAANEGSLTIWVSTGSGGEHSLKFDGNATGDSSGNVLTIADVSKGSHTIGRNSTEAEIYYLCFQED